MHEDTRILLASLGWGEGQSIDLNQWFGADERETVGFEITFAAFVATVILTAPPTGTLIDTVASSAGILLLGLTLARRMALDSPMVNYDLFMSRTTRYIMYLTFIGVFYVGISGSELAATHLPSHVYITAGLLIFLASFGFAILYELLYADLFLWAAIGLYNRQISKATTNQYFNGLLSVSRLLLKLSIHDFNSDHPVIERIYERDLGNVSTDQRRIVYFIFVITFVLLFVLFVIASIPLIFLIDINIVTAVIVGITMLPSTLVVSGLVQFFYARYGNSTFEQVTSSIKIHYLLPLVYVLLILHAGIL